MIDESVLGSGEKLHQICDSDLRTLEQALPLLTENIPHSILAQRPDLVEWMEMVKQILSNVRWGYMPSSDYSESETVE